MKIFNLFKTHRAAGSVAGLIAALLLVAGAVWAEKNNGKIAIQTGSSEPQASAPTQSAASVNPLREMIQMQCDLNRFVGMPFAAFSEMPQMAADWEGAFVRPDMDLSEQPDAYYVKMDLPGMDKSGITVEVKDNILTVKAETKKETTKKDGGKLLMQERSSGFMSRAVMLAKPVDATKVTAEYNDGVLKITLPKMQADQPAQRVDIK